MPLQIAKDASAKDVPLPQTIFSQPLSAYNIPLIKRILSIFYQQNTFRQREPRISLLHKLARIEQSRTDKVRDAVAQLLRLNIPITRAAVKAGPHDEDVDGELTGVEEGTDCEVCLRALLPENFPQQDIASKCEHKAHMCTSCLEQAVMANVESNSWDTIRCPCSNCERLLDSSIVRKYLKGSLLGNYKKYIDKLEIHNLPNFRWCLNPSGCGDGQVYNDSTKNLKVACHACEFEMCFSCQTAWHEGMLCPQSYNDASISKSANLIRHTTKLCPRCKAPTSVDKDDIGCGNIVSVVEDGTGTGPVIERVNFNNQHYYRFR
ncbi:hypothetical protein BHYA_0087g00410 [Botrytis hyacinthi]|uniref:RBR-type E3 ubiquitin transferase n=1 Tax=Botrytis hyacinthi TaxID=278943 RepID=A0A4Z1GR24_9HELO|nr:hypothetical protein BHYA_0087g00410 [Botrytis hyacinthi]